MLQQQLLVPHHYRRRLLGLGPGPDFQVHVRGGYPQLRKKIARHAGVVMLTSVDQPVCQPPSGSPMLLQGSYDGGNFHKIGPGARNNVDESQFATPESSMLIRLTSKISSSGIGVDLQPSMASTKALAQAFCPLSCRHRFIFVKPGQP